MSKHRTVEGEMVTELIEPPRTSCAESQAEDALSSLPPELLAIIIRKLDTTSISNLHNTCRYLRNVVQMPGVVKKLDLSLSTLATVKTKLNIFHEILGHVRVLNLSGVYDLDLPALVRALEHMESLVDLDVSYTNVTMPDFLQFRKVRPTLKSIVINFYFNVQICDWQISKDELLDYQQAFEGFRSVHFVYTGAGDDAFGPGKAAIIMLQKADLSSLTFTISNGNFTCFDELEEMIDWNMTDVKLKASQFKVHILRDKHYEVHRCLSSIRFMDVEKCEIFAFVYRSERNILFATPLIREIINKRFAVEVTSLPESTTFSLLDSTLKRIHDVWCEIYVILWDRERNQFDGEFCSQLSSIFKEYFVFNVSSEMLTQIPSEFKWYAVNQVNSASHSSTELDYGEAFKAKHDIKLKIRFEGGWDDNPPKIINNKDFLRKISHLSLSDYVPDNSDVFNILFDSCELLVTLQIFAGTFDAISLQSVKKSKSLKNIFFEGFDVELSSVFSCLSESPTLECIHLIQFRSLRFKCLTSLPDPNELFSKCCNLYYFCIQAKMRDTTREGTMTFYKHVKSRLGKSALTIDIRGDTKYTYTPYMNVFNVFQLRPMS